MMEISVRKELGHWDLEVDLKVERGEFLAITGPSGSGKTTLLRILAGLERAEGEIVVDGEVWLRGRRSLPPQKRSIGFLFQEYALFPNMKVIENLLFVADDRKLAHHLLEVVELLPYRESYPMELSGGQKQRVALARAFMGRPRLLLLDEPLAALDPAMRMKLQGEIERLHREFGTTTLMVSHDRGEIARLAGRVVEMERGRIVERGADPIVEAVRR
ncbi:MAG: ATP-binding cassette domain-containing protein [Epsilonproteobacteria bacterium]|nr:ABC transporter ATP-binding protein [Campylobacterota bacterium]NPA57257.1 ATP-binding cassette domain-containing protein [Campylobacterota bacterium]